jgi:hypothetical protein
MSVAGDYQPGTCNIGEAEIQRRQRAGWGGTTVFFLVLFFLMMAKVGQPAWYLILFLPAFAASAGFVQAAYRFCFYFGFASLFNFDQAGERHHIADAAARRQDRAKALRILALSALIAVVVTLVVFGAAMLFT